MAALTSFKSTRKMKQLLSAVLMELPNMQAEKFHADHMLEGYTSYLKYLTKEKTSMMVSNHEVYEVQEIQSVVLESHSVFKVLSESSNPFCLRGHG